MISQTVVVHASGIESASGETALTNTLGGLEASGTSDVRFYLSLTASAVPTTLDVDIVATVGGVDYVLGSFAQLGAVGAGTEVITIANCPANVKAEFTIVGTSYTFSIHSTR